MNFRMNDEMHCFFFVFFTTPYIFPRDQPMIWDRIRNLKWRKKRCLNYFFHRSVIFSLESDQHKILLLNPVQSYKNNSNTLRIQPIMVLNDLKYDLYPKPPLPPTDIIICLLSWSRFLCSFFLFSVGGLANETSISNFPNF